MTQRPQVTEAIELIEDLAISFKATMEKTRRALRDASSEERRALFEATRKMHDALARERAAMLAELAIAVAS